MSLMPSDGLPSSGVGSWTWRRIFLWMVNGFCAATVVYCLWKNLDTRVAETAVFMSFSTMMMSVGSYVFGAVWDDRNKMDLLGARIGEDASKVANRPLK